jgi:hypothetical protein
MFIWNCRRTALWIACLWASLALSFAQSGAQISSPAAGSTLSDVNVTFTWNAAPGADYYWLDVGNIVSQGDIFAGQVAGTSRTLTGLPCDGRTLYVQLWTHIAGTGWADVRRYTYTAFSGCTFAVLTSPQPGTLPGNSVLFAWSPVAGADAYWLDVGNTVAQGDIFAGQTAAASKALTSLPCDGRPLYVQLWTHKAGDWLAPQRYTFTAAMSCAVAQIANPAPGTILTSTSPTFTWFRLPNTDAYWLDVGTTQGQGDIWGQSTADNFLPVNGIPCNGRTVYVQLFAHSNAGIWQPPQQFTYAAPSSCAQLTSPAPGSTLNGNTVTFAWSADTGADQYWLDVGKSPGVGDIYAQPTPATAVVVNNVPCDGSLVYVQLWSRRNGLWQTPNRYTFNAGYACN